MKSEGKYFWHGEPVSVRFGYCLIKEIKEQPLWWWNYEVLAFGAEAIHAIEVTQKDGHMFLIANHHSIGVYKLENGGWPDLPHFSLDGCEFVESSEMKYVPHDPFRHMQYENERKRWQVATYPEESKRMLALEDLIRGKR